MKKSVKQKIQEHLESLYGTKQSSDLYRQIVSLLDNHRKLSDLTISSEKINKFTEKDVVLIAYGDIIQSSSQPPLQCLKKFLDRYLAEQINTVHILPFFPYSSDDGFSVIDYRKVDPDLGTWEDIHDLAQTKKMMFDAVINHISSESDWFKSLIAEDPRYEDYFIEPGQDWDLSNVVRPRTSPLLTEVKTAAGTKKVWTTFSADQIDLNYANPEVLLEILDLLLFYLRQGATIIRLDAIAYLWKKSGTTCIHLPETHRVIKLLRLVLEEANPEVVLITETNVPHKENISYFGEFDPKTGQTDEAHMVYQFPLAPLVLHTLISGSARHLSVWANRLETRGVFFNFIASHDGIGVLPATGILSEDELQRIIDQIHRHGGQLSHRSNPDGSETVYELNTTLYDALNDPEAPNPEIDMNRYMASQVILLSLAGVPGIYYHSLFGSRNAHELVQKTGRARSINRGKFSWNQLQAILEDDENIHKQIFDRYRHLLSVRIKQPAFHPRGIQNVLRLDDRIFGLERIAPDQSSAVLTFVNISPDPVNVSFDVKDAFFKNADTLLDLISGKKFNLDHQTLRIRLEPYQFLWLINEK
jgi:sucrose phosphorylase